MRKNNRKNQSGPRVIKSTGDRVFDVVNIVLMCVLFVIFLYPFWDTLLLSFSNAASASKRSLRIIPDFPLVFDAYKKVFSESMFLRSFWNSIVRTAVGTGLSVVFTVCAGFVMAKRTLPGRKFFMGFILFTMFFSGGLIPTYLLMQSLHLTNSFWALILPSLTSAWNIIIARNFMATVPSSLEEAAIIDGASTFKVLTRIYVPLSKPIIAVLSLWSAIGHWNAWFDVMIYTPGRDKMTLAYLLRKILVESDTKSVDMLRNNTAAMTPTTVKAATIVIATVTIAMLYPLFQKHFMKGINIGAVKG